MRLTTPKGPKAVAGFLLQAIPSRLSSEASGVTRISLFVVTAEVKTVTLVAPAGIATLPAEAEPQLAFAVAEAQLPLVPRLPATRPCGNAINFVAGS